MFANLQLRGAAFAIIPLMLAVSGIILSAPRLLPSALQLQADSVTAPLYRGEAVSIEQTKWALERLEESTRLNPLTDPTRELADLVHRLYLSKTPADSVALAKMQMLEDRIRLSLSLSPLDSYMLTRLAHTQLWLGQPNRQVLESITAAMQIAPHARNLVLRRLRVAFPAWLAASTDEMLVLQEQVRFAYITLNHRDAVIQLAKDYSALGLVATSLQGYTMWDGSDAHSDFFVQFRLHRSTGQK